ncbi:MAG: NAD(P)H-binding protein, partial [Alphaproteobacteria bacterium]|nr:NAD(P)H-binding protein [Alphaproteobacteria bacterium]
MRVLVLGGYGLVGLEIVRALREGGLDVAGFGRSVALGKRLTPGIAWLGGDLAQFTRPQDWAVSLEGIDAVVNASGALQDSFKDRLAVSQDASISALIAACEAAGIKKFVQISAPGAEPGASTAFLRTKASADAALRASKLDWTILKPGLVISGNSYGGTTLLRMLAAFPLVQPLVLGGARIQTVAGSDVGAAVLAVLTGGAPARHDYDLVEDQAHELRAVVEAIRLWVGREPAGCEAALPRWMGVCVAMLADAAGWLGWRSPLRSTALKVLAADVLGDPRPWTEVTGRRLKSLEETLRALPSSLQERVFGRAQLVFPVLVVTLAGFFLASGAIGWAQRDQAAAVLEGTIAAGNAGRLVGAGAALDLLIGIGLLVRRWTRRAAWGGILLSAA